ncbi:hypothetical protein BO94DRAFT_580155 [Aspergillus sclerotioniger CBS 115572]|uniref:Mid2 domain-containing protein n=1 Tax=Aspergillus sclerotioniger CBS 115572 TaxID=1450535 RepID=A0A317XCD5_9EURO|nr:hypothetical protein BO94DRAFT_580155 [Aspergillus sclerotioniger CBS 115572]PWY96294.1 hypothetical protein BO94DRAFT_580155 [Aspergillus sclerotioniger CBS 115572]
MSQIQLIISCFLLILSSPIVMATCYAPDGTTTSDSRYIPCIGIQNEFSMCCRLNDTNPDLCWPNGLCYWPAENQYYRNFCSDKSWESPNCLPRTVCDDAAGGSSTAAAQVVWCGNDSYCCGTNNDCCTSDQAFSLKSTLVSIGSNSTSSGTATVTATVTDIVSAGGDGTEESSKKKSVAIGVGVGVPLGVLSIVMLGAGYLWGRNITRAKYEAVQQTLPEGQMYAFNVENTRQDANKDLDKILDDVFDIGINEEVNIVIYEVGKQAHLSICDPLY